MNSSHLGYVTINAKYIILVEDAIAPDDIQIQKTRENELKILLVSPGNKACWNIIFVVNQIISF